MKAIVLAGGVGERLRPLTDEVPKPLLLLQGKAIVEHIFDILKKNNVTDVTLAVGYKKEKVMERFADGSAFGFNIDYIEEDEPLGTAGFLKMMPIKETTLVMNGDDIFDFNLNDFLKKHKEFVEKGAVATLSLVSLDDTESFGTVKLDADKIADFVEKGKPASNFVSVGHYLIEPTVMQYLPDKKRIMFETDIFPKLAAEGRLFAYPSNAKWIYIRDLEDYRRLNKE